MNHSGYHLTLAGQASNLQLLFLLQALAVTTSDSIPSGNNSSNITGIHCIIKISNYGTLSKLLGVTAYTCRFPTNCRKQQEDRLKGPLTPLELHNAQTRWVKQSQKEVYSSIIDHLTSHSSSHNRIPLIRQLRLFLDAGWLDSLWRQNTRYTTV